MGQDDGSSATAGQQVPLGMDWDSDPSTLSDHLKFIRSVNWESTKIGIPSQWPQQLMQCVDLCLADPTPAAIMWGDDLTVRIPLIYFCLYYLWSFPTLGFTVTDIYR
jgi:hypothetical protein